MKLRIDLHSHSTCSDGELSPSELIDLATKGDLDILALTDHDTISGLEEAKNYIKENGLKLKLIPGIEFSTLWNEKEIHIVGLGFDINNKDLLATIHKNQNLRNSRIKEISKKLNEMFNNKFDFSFDTSSKSITRAHFARKLIEYKIVRSNQEAFDKYLGVGAKGYVESSWISMKEAIKAIEIAGGIAVLAHPFKYNLNLENLAKLCYDFKTNNGKAVELLKKGSTKVYYAWLVDFLRKNNLQASLGSDFHSPRFHNNLASCAALPSQLTPVWYLPNLTSFIK
ncbi:MAG: PHP domain-containing protein [Psittacicella sp.]